MIFTEQLKKDIIISKITKKLKTYEAEDIPLSDLIAFLKSLNWTKIRTAIITGLHNEKTKETDDISDKTETVSSLDDMETELTNA